MINLTKLWTGTSQPADALRYGHGHGAADAAVADGQRGVVDLADAADARPRIELLLEQMAKDSV